MSWYSNRNSLTKTANEFIGADATYQDGGHTQQVNIGNIENQNLPATISNGPPNGEETIAPKRLENCPVCKQPLVESEHKGYSNHKKETVFYCRNCGHTNDDYKRSVEKGKPIKQRRSRIKKRRSKFASIDHLRIAATPANPMMSSYNNPMNSPYGRQDLSEDERVIPWDRVDDGFWNEFDKVKQKNNVDQKTIKVKRKDGTYRYIRIKKKDTGGNAIQPSNTFNQKGRVKKQPRFNPPDGKDTKEGHGAWPHNRNMIGEGSGWYQNPGTGNLDADMKNRVTEWSDYVNDRNSSGLFR